MEMSIVTRQKRHQMLMKFCKADRNLMQLEKRVGLFSLYLEVSCLRKCHHKVMKRVLELMRELIPDRLQARHFRYRYSEEFQENIDSIVLNLAVGVTQFRNNSFMIAIVALRGQLTPPFLIGCLGLAAAVTDAANETFRMLRQEFGRSFHGGDPIQNERLLQQLEKFDRLLAEFELAWVCDGTAQEIVEALKEIQGLGELFLRAAKWAIERGFVCAEDLVACEPEVMTTLPRLAVLMYLTEPATDSATSREYTVFQQHRDELATARRLLDKLDTAKRDQITQRLCLRTETDDPEAVRVFRAVASAADQMQSNHPVESNYLMKIVCARCGTETPRSDEGQEENLGCTVGPVKFAPDSELNSCSNPECQAEFSVMQRRHHCRHCGGLFCNDCTKQSMPLPLLGHHNPVRVCQPCADKVSQAMLVKEAPDWVPDNSSQKCSNGGCRVEFSLLRRRHHCRACGGLFCHSCSSWTAALPQFGFNKPVRLCEYCHWVHGSLELPAQ